ncbi:MAG: hypothetical protein ACD_46C00031G0002 [uncultured bacterium]|nr:MAG: hypothetical protein ACD_46C00031G0002 [uncultured bacterium]
MAVSTEQKIALIKMQPCFKELNDKETRILAELLEEEHFPAGSTIVTQGDRVDSIYIIVQGEVDVQHISYKDDLIERKSIATLGQNEAIGLSETGFYSISGIRTATVIAITNLVLLRLSVTLFRGFALAHSHASDVMRKFAESMPVIPEDNF